MTNFVGKNFNYTYRNIVNPFNSEESDCSDQRFDFYAGISWRKVRKAKSDYGYAF